MCLYCSQVVGIYIYIYIVVCFKYTEVHPNQPLGNSGVSPVYLNLPVYRNGTETEPTMPCLQLKISKIGNEYIITKLPNATVNNVKWQ